MNNVKSETEQLAQAKTSGLAIASLVLGICGFFTCGLSALVGIVLGIVAIVAIKKRADQLKGRGLAAAGITVSALSFVLVPLMMIMLAILMPTVSRARTHAMAAISLSHAKQLSIAMVMYCNDHDGRFPPCDTWPDALDDYIGDKKILTSPSDPDAGRAWAMNAQLAGRKINEIKQPHQVVLIFEAEFGSPPAGARELLPQQPRGPRGYVIAFLDGHVEIVRPDRLDNLIWIPGTQGFEVVR